MSDGRARVLMLGFDAMDPRLTEELAAEGRLPTFRELFRTSALRPIRNPPGLFVGSLWSTFFTGRSAVDTGFHCWEKVIPGRYEKRLTTADSIRGKPFWETLSEAGSHVAVIDVPHSRAGAPLNGVQISEWGCHDRHFGLRSHPPELAQQIVEHYGPHPVLGAEPFATREWAPDDYLFRAGPLRTVDEEQQLLAGLMAGVATKKRMSLDLLADGPWDLFLSVFGETHSVGHQSWHLHDPTHPRHDADARRQVGDPLCQVYELMDAVLAEHLALVDDTTTVFVLLSHGMGAHHDGTHLLPEMLRRLEAAYRTPLRRSLEGRTLGRAWLAAPEPIRSSLRRPLATLLRARLRHRVLRPPRDYETDEERRSQAFFMSPNNFVVGGVRVNLHGREEAGLIKGRAELDQLCDLITADLLALVNVETGTSVIDRVERSDEHYDRQGLDALPDLFLHWNQDHPIETVWSPRLGMIHGPYTHWRTGDHRPGGVLLMRPPGAVAGADQRPIAIEQLGAMIATELGVELVAA